MTLQQLLLPSLPEVSVDVSPAEVLFSEGVDSRQQVQLTNRGEKTVAMKVMCSNNNFFRVRPVHTLIDPNTSQQIELLLFDKPPPLRKDYIAIQLISCESDVNPLRMFKAKESDHEIIVPLKLQTDNALHDADEVKLEDNIINAQA